MEQQETNSGVREKNPGNKKKKIMIIAVIIALVAFSAFRIISANWNVAESEKHAVNVKGTAAKIADIEITTPLSGTIKAENQVSVMAGLQSQVGTVSVAVGDYVTKGSTLFTLDTSQVQGGYQQAAASVNIAKEGLSSAKTNYDRMTLLYQEGAVSAQVYEQAKTQYATAQAQLSQASGALSTAAESMGNGTVTAPISGYVTELNVVTGQYPSPGTPAVTIADTGSLELSTNVSEYLVSKVKIGNPVLISIKSISGHTFTGTVKTVAPAPGTGSLTYPVIISIDEGQEGIMAGMFAEAHIISEQKKGVLCIPSDSVLIKSSETLVVILEGTKPSFRSVTTGLDNGEMVEITQGLSQGDMVVTSGQQYVVDGEDVKIIEE